MIDIAICDDEVSVLQHTKRLLEAYPGKEFHIDTFTSGESLLNSTLAYEIILLDIDMQQLNGIETAKQIRQKNKTVKLIYVTNYSDYTVFAFAVHAFAYLLKPLKSEELYQQLDEAFEYTQLPAVTLLEFSTTEGILRISPKDIFYFEHLNRKVYLRTLQSTHILKHKITELAAELADKGFFMPHKSFVVNLYSVKSIKGYDILLSNGLAIPLSQKKSMEFRKALNHYLSAGMGVSL